MPVQKQSVSIMPQIYDNLGLRSEGNLSGTINRSLDRYFAILARSVAELRNQLSTDECALILDATNGSMFSDTISIGMLWHEIEDACRLDGLDAKWNVDGSALVEKIRNSGAVGQLALIDASERWWLRVGNGEQPEYSELLSSVGTSSRYPYNEE